MSEVPFPRDTKNPRSSLKAVFKKMVTNGEIPIVNGTHALVEKPLSFKYSAYAIIRRTTTLRHFALANSRDENDIVPHLLDDGDTHSAHTRTHPLW